MQARDLVTKVREQATQVHTLVDSKLQAMLDAAK